LFQFPKRQGLYQNARSCAGDQALNQAQEDIGTLRASDRAKVLDAIEIHLRYEPEKLSKSRIKRLKVIAQPQYVS
jgi:hypothetical protein